MQTRLTVLDHLRRVGSPTPYDRILAGKYGTKALELGSEGKFGHMVSHEGNEDSSVPVKEVILKLRIVPPGSQLIRATRAVGTFSGD